MAKKKKFPVRLAEEHLEAVLKSEWCQRTASEELNSYGLGYVNGMKRAIALVKCEVDPSIVLDFMKW